MGNESSIFRADLAKELGISVKTLHRRIEATKDHDFVVWYHSRRIFTVKDKVYIFSKIDPPPPPRKIKVNKNNTFEVNHIPSECSTRQFNQFLSSTIAL